MAASLVYCLGQCYVMHVTCSVLQGVGMPFHNPLSATLHLSPLAAAFVLSQYC